jgi:hypothetical protein
VDWPAGRLGPIARHFSRGSRTASTYADYPRTAQPGPKKGNPGVGTSPSSLDPAAHASSWGTFCIRPEDRSLLTSYMLFLRSLGYLDVSRTMPSRRPFVLFCGLLEFGFRTNQNSPFGLFDGRPTWDGSGHQLSNQSAGKDQLLRTHTSAHLPPLAWVSTSHNSIYRLSLLDDSFLGRPSIVRPSSSEKSLMGVLSLCPCAAKPS